MKNVAFWDIKTPFVLHRRHYVSATESIWLMLCKILGFYGGAFEECTLVGRDRRFGGTYRHLHHGDKNGRARNNVSSNTNRRTLRSISCKQH
jgi:hypothetical protein